MNAPTSTGRKNFPVRENRERSLLTVKLKRTPSPEQLQDACVTRTPSTVAVFSIPGVEGRKGPRLISWRLRENEIAKYFQNFLLRFAEAP